MLGFGVLGPLEITGPDGAAMPLAGDRQRALVALLLAHAGRVVGAEQLADAVFADRPPANPAAALHSQVSRLRRLLGPQLVSRPSGYALRVEAGGSTRPGSSGCSPGRARHRRPRPWTCCARRSDSGAAPAYSGISELETVRLEAIRLEELRLTATEDLAEALTASGRAAAAVPLLEPFVAGNPLRERARAALMRALYSDGRHADALRHYATYREHLADELGLEPSVALQRLELDILRHGVVSPPGAPAPAALDRLQARYVRRHDGHKIAVAVVGTGPPLVVVPAWVTSLELVASGRDPRASLLERLARRTRLTLYDRLGTGLSRGPAVPDHGLDASTAELEAVLERSTGPASVLGISQAGPIAVALAARRPELVRRLVLMGTYADGPATFPSAELRAPPSGLVRSHSRLGTAMLAGLFRPGAGDEASRLLAGVLRDSADPMTAADYLAAVYTADVSALLPQVVCARAGTALPGRPTHSVPRRPAARRRTARRAVRGAGGRLPSARRPRPRHGRRCGGGVPQPTRVSQPELKLKGARPSSAARRSSSAISGIPTGQSTRTTPSPHRRTVPGKTCCSSRMTRPFSGRTNPVKPRVAEVSRHFAQLGEQAPPDAAALLGVDDRHGQPRLAEARSGQPCDPDRVARPPTRQGSARRG